MYEKFSAGFGVNGRCLKRAKREAKLLRGIIMFFSENGEMAHIWCAEADNPLFLAESKTFPEVWPRLDVGSVVLVEMREGSARQVVRHLEILEDEAP